MLKNLAIVAILLALAVAGSVSIIKNSKETGQAAKEIEKTTNRHTLKSLAKKAKETGKNVVVIPAPQIEYAGEADDPDFVFSNYSSVVAQPVESKSYALATDKIVTWYKFKILETLSQRPPLSDLPTAELPQDLLPLNEDEFLVATIGGSLSIDEVNVVMNNSELPPFSMDQRYLLFVSKNPSGFAILWAGPTGAYTITPDDRIVSVNDRAHPIKEALKRRFRGSVRQLREWVRTN
jgi:hypothetical protein